MEEWRGGGRALPFIIRPEGRGKTGKDKDGQDSEKRLIWVPKSALTGYTDTEKIRVLCS